MNIKQANHLDFRELLSRLGHEPVEIAHGGNTLRYLSPLREGEKKPSFHIRRGSTYPWIFNDFGMNIPKGEGTTIINFMRLYLRNPDKKNALDKINALFPDYAMLKSDTGKSRKKTTEQLSLLSPTQNQITPSGETKWTPIDNFENLLEDFRDLEFVKNSPLQSPFIFSYLEGRGIPQSIAQRYFRLIHYRNKKKPSSKPYFAFGMRNINGGWEIRSASDEPKLLFKSALLVRDISLIKGAEQGRGDVLVFEGMLDFASLLVLRKREQFKADALILNGLASYSRAKAYIEKYEYKRIHTFLDNNPSGQATAQMFKDDFGDKVTNLSYMFAPHVDLNDALKAGHRLNLKPRPEPPIMKTSFLFPHTMPRRGVKE